MRKFFVLLAVTSGLVTILQAQPVHIVPEPASMIQPRIAARYTITPSTKIFLDGSGLEKSARYLNDYLKKIYGFELKVETGSGNGIVLNYEKIEYKLEGAYNLQVNQKGVYIAGDNETGVFYGVQTLLQLLPAEGKPKNLSLAYVNIKDYPRFEYRGLHLDEGRHFMGKDFVKRYIDYIAFHKLNYFHWHLTEDQGWRIEIKKYPRLTEVGAWRNGTVIGRFPGTGNDNIRRGGFYTQDEIREIVKYAADRYVTIIPEIEMPGHASAAIAAYPELSCFPDEPTIRYYPKASAWAGDSTGKQVIQSWGVYDDVFVPSENTFKFLENVLDEVLALFPSKYIHIGGDECPKENWKRSEFCQQLIKEKGLKDEHGLQSYFIGRMEKYINSKGRNIIGWDEILEGGLAPNALVMSWRGEEGGIAAAKENHQAIMTPGNYVYLDHSQSRNEDSVTIGGFTPLEEIYGYEPIPAELPADKNDFILGAQANVWTEYMNNPRKVEYMIFPRLAALSELLWSPKDKRNWKQFEQKVPTLMHRYDQWGANYSKAYFDTKGTVGETGNNKGVQLTLESVAPDVQASYQFTADGKAVGKKNHYAKPLVITESGLLTAWNEMGGKTVGAPANFHFNVNKATGKKIQVTTPPSKNYGGQGGAFGLVNGLRSDKGMSSPEWLGWHGEDFEAVIDMGAVQQFTNVNLHTIAAKGSWVYAPTSLELWTSNDGKEWKPAGKSSAFLQMDFNMGFLSIQVPNGAARYIKLKAVNFGEIPSGANGEGKKAWLFVDEIEVI
ncbi:glycoside hydrolase family 20 protein [Flavihumibacter petaseus]|uniref:beta-N-acetylhexosaminidase n=1 Tax=Flavihumibacter petaseus NBRC 106054 TaxID=1220578 RepID=A0A0E9N1G6_9BACT|nr:family 20 glycosylhydrolase [Flavihumibacter petaseus]GAO43694.1 putative beta-hexosaminidase [Flavihumibacter petaseus NBRC 106054]